MNMSRLDFRLEAQDPGGRARAGTFRTLHGTVEFPLFMPVGTNASVKGVRPEELASAGSQILLANTYHLLLRPGPEVFEKAGGIHKFMNWKGSVLTDSGGFQIFSLPHSRTISENGAAFRSYTDGRMIHLSPEKSISMQKSIGSDIMMVLDQCIPSTADYRSAEDAMNLTHRWALRSLRERGDSPQAVFGIIQGALHKELRRISAETLSSMVLENGESFDGLAIGGLAVGESKEEREEFVHFTASLMPADRPRYLMGVGTPIDLLEAVNAGADMFDCIIPGALAQQSVAYTSTGRHRLRRTAYRFSEESLDSQCDCYTCRNYSRAYLHHLYKAGEPLLWNLLTVHNITFYHRLMKNARDSILNGTFQKFYKEHKLKLSITDDEDYPLVQKKNHPKKDKNVLGDFRVILSSDGYYRISHIPSGEVMHPGQDPLQEAETLYTGQSLLRERVEQLCDSEFTGISEKQLVLWDVGLGAAYNSLSAIKEAQAAFSMAGNPAGSARSDCKTVFKIISFENNTDALRLAVRHAGRFSHLQHPGPASLLKNGRWTQDFSAEGFQAKIDWILSEGDFFSEAEKAVREGSPHIIFYDPYSLHTNHRFW